jgi:transposase
MAKTRLFDPGVKELIIQAVRDGESYEKVAQRFKVSKSGVGKLVKRFKRRGTVENAKSPGRPQKVGVRTKNLLIRLSKDDPRKTATTLLNDLKDRGLLDCSVDTVKRILRQANLFGRRPVKKPMISVKNRKARISFAKEHLNWEPKDWSKVLFSDESKFMLFGSDGIKYVRRPIGHRFDPKYQLPTVKHGGGNVMVWGCFSRDNIGPIHLIDGIMEQTQYKEIMEKIMLPHAKRVMPRGWIFQQDNDPKHTAKSVQKFFDAKKVRVLEWPSQSPDLNPIENLWEHLDRQLAGRKPSNKADLFKRLQDAWANISLEYIIKLIDSMPRRCQAVIDAKGYATKY